jgi:hypothetical protein
VLTVYPTPASVILIAVTIPAELIRAVAVAVVPIPGELKLLMVKIVYPDPPFVIVIIPTIPSAISVVAAAPTPPPPIKKLLVLQYIHIQDLLSSTP